MEIFFFPLAYNQTFKFIAFEWSLWWAHCSLQACSMVCSVPTLHHGGWLTLFRECDDWGKRDVELCSSSANCPSGTVWGRCGCCCDCGDGRWTLKLGQKRVISMVIVGTAWPGSWMQRCWLVEKPLSREASEWAGNTFVGPKERPVRMSLSPRSCTLRGAPVTAWLQRTVGIRSYRITILFNGIEKTTKHVDLRLAFSISNIDYVCWNDVRTWYLFVVIIWLNSDLQPI